MEDHLELLPPVLLLLPSKVGESPLEPCDVPGRDHLAKTRWLFILFLTLGLLNSRSEIID